MRRKRQNNFFFSLLYWTHNVLKCAAHACFETVPHLDGKHEPGHNIKISCRDYFCWIAAIMTKFHICTTMPCMIYKELWVWHVCVCVRVCRTLDARYLCPTKNLQHTELKQTPIWLPRRLALGSLSPPLCSSSCASVGAQTSNHSHTDHTHTHDHSLTHIHSRTHRTCTIIGHVD